MKYTVKIKETLIRKIEVEADSEDEAVSIVEDKYNNQEVVLTADDFIEVEFKTTDNEEESAIIKMIKRINSSFFEEEMPTSWNREVEKIIKQYNFDEETMTKIYKFCENKQLLNLEYMKSVAEAVNMFR